MENPSIDCSIAVMMSPTGPAPMTWTRVSARPASIVVGSGIGDVSSGSAEIVRRRKSRIHARHISWRSRDVRTTGLRAKHHGAEKLAQRFRSPAARENDEPAQAVGRERLPGKCDQLLGRLLGDLSGRFP